MTKHWPSGDEFMQIDTAKNPYVLCMGYRQPLAEALGKARIPYTVVHPQPLKKLPPDVDHVLISELSAKPTHLKKLENLLEQHCIRPTHVIAGTEAAVIPASFIRRYFGARLSEQTLIRRCSNKAEMKRYLKAKNIPMTKFIISTGRETARELIQELGLPVVVKPVYESGGRGVRICPDIQTLEQSLGRHLLYESFIDADEGSVESFINKGEILFTNITEYFVRRHANIVPASYASDEIQQFLALNEQVIKKLKINWGMTHLEFYRNNEGLYFGEIALRPPGGYIMHLIQQAYNFDPWEAFLNIEIDRDTSFPKRPSGYAACWIHHPGPGHVKSIAETSQLKGLVRHKLKVGIGDFIESRVGVGNDVGYSLFASQTVDDLKESLSSTAITDMIQLT